MNALFLSLFFSFSYGQDACKTVSVFTWVNAKEAKMRHISLSTFMYDT